MAANASALQRVKLRAFDLSERTTQLGRTSLERRVSRLRSRGFLITQVAVTAGLSWFIASEIFRHQQPFFAPIASIVCLGGTFGHRMRRGFEVALGVAVGIGIGDIFVQLFGAGVWQVVVVVALAMSLATFLGAGQLMITQAGVQSIVVTILLPNPNQGFARWLDAVVGCAVALLVATIAPSSPLRKPGRLAAEMLQELAATLDAVRDALTRHSEDAADEVLERARNSESRLRELDEANSEGLAVVRHSPFRRRQRAEVQAYADLLVPLDRASRNLRVLARRAVIAVWRHQEVPEDYLELLSAVADASRFMASELFEGRLPAAARDQLVAAGERTAQVPLTHSLSSVVILAQVRSMVVDLLELTGLRADEARELVPDVE